MLLNNLVCKAPPRALLVDVVAEGRDGRGWHVIYYDVGFGDAALEEGFELVTPGHGLRVMQADRGPEEKVAAFFFEFGQRLACAREQVSVQVDQREVDVDKNIGVLHPGELLKKPAGAEHDSTAKLPSPPALSPSDWGREGLPRVQARPELF